MGRKSHSSYFPNQELRPLRVSVRKDNLAKYAFLAQISGQPLFQLVDEAMDMAYGILLKATEDRQQLLLRQRMAAGVVPAEALQAINNGDVRVAKGSDIAKDITSNIDNFLNSLEQ